MKYSNEKARQIRWLMVFAALLVLLIIYFKHVLQGMVLVLGMIKPFLIGGIIAFIVNIPMRAIENRILGKWKGKLASRLKRPISMILAIVFLVLLISLLFVTVVPQLGKTLAELGAKVPVFLDNALEQLKLLSARYPEIYDEVAKLETMELDWEGIFTSVATFLKSGITSMVTSTIGVASSIIGGVFNGVISFIFALYILSQKEKLADQGKRIVRAYTTEKTGARVIRVFTMLNKNFSNFVTGQCLEAVILGVLFIIFMSIFGMPYAVLVGVLIAFTALIPIVGAFIGCGVGAFLILIDDPILALWFVIMFLIIQQLEGNLIYPRVVGGSVGLPSIWILVAVSLGGSLFGVAGMLFFIPLLSTAYALLRENVNARNEAKEAEWVAQQEKEKAADEADKA
ncbi:MAG: AI-2E family transporter [Lachnospiraceae bacterium]|nr:AI-2E family transporter [Lachnospiraceae bacterium]